ncbi:MAG TPA: DUF1080 domain-containing protein [Longimicrobiaceae bacterium]
MRHLPAVGAAVLLALGCASVQAQAQEEDEGWISIFDGKTLDGWRASENPSSFRVEDGVLVVQGPRAHLFYVGPVENHNFRNFEWKADILTYPQANSGMYFHTEFQESGWPSKGYEVQVNNSHSDPRRTGSLYAVEDVMNVSPARDGEWFTQHVIVQGKRVRVLVNGEEVVDYTEPENVERDDMSGRVLSSGTVAIQAHDPNSRVHYRNIMIRPLPD